MALDRAHLHHGEEQPDDGHVNGEPGELIAGPRAERARPAGPAQGADQTAAFAALDENQQDEEQPNAKNQTFSKGGTRVMGAALRQSFVPVAATNGSLVTPGLLL